MQQTFLTSHSFVVRKRPPLPFKRVNQKINILLTKHKRRCLIIYIYKVKSRNKLPEVPCLNVSNFGLLPVKLPDVRNALCIVYVT